MPAQTISYLLDNEYLGCQWWENQKIYGELVKKVFKRYYPNAKFTIIGQGTESIVLQKSGSTDVVIKITCIELPNRSWSSRVGKRWFDAPSKVLFRKTIGDDLKEEVVIYEQPKLLPMSKLETGWDFYKSFRNKIAPYLVNRDGSENQWGYSKTLKRWFLMDYGAYDHRQHVKINRYIIRNTVGYIPAELMQ